MRELSGIELDDLDAVARIREENWQRREADRIMAERSRQSALNSDRTYWEKIANAVLPRFNECEAGERIHVAEVKRRLSQVREAGYDVQPYSHMNARKAWQYLSQIRRNVYENARKYCPDVVSAIDRKNKERMLDAEEIR